MMAEQESPWLQVIARSLAYLAFHKQELSKANLVEQAAFLEGLGLPRDAVAAMLDTTSESIRVGFAKKKKSGKGKKK